MSNPPVDQQLLNEVRQRLMETGDWDRIAKALRAQLEESGWEDDVKDMAKERARAQETPNLKDLLAEISPKAEELVRQDIRRAVTQEIEAVLDREVEQV